MANDEHLEILETGVEAWNVWLRENLRVWPDLVEAGVGTEVFRAGEFGGRQPGARASSLRSSLPAPGYTLWPLVCSGAGLWKPPSGRSGIVRIVE